MPPLDSAVLDHNQRTRTVSSSLPAPQLLAVWLHFHDDAPMLALDSAVLRHTRHPGSASSSFLEPRLMRHSRRCSCVLALDFTALHHTRHVAAGFDVVAVCSDDVMGDGSRARLSRRSRGCLLLCSCRVPVIVICIWHWC
jgi:hypothetical protein